MPDYRNMTAKEAIRAAKEESGLTIEQIARRLNVSTSVVKRYLKEDDVYSPRLDMLPRSCVVLGDTVLPDWMASQIRRDDDERREKYGSSGKNMSGEVPADGDEAATMPLFSCLNAVAAFA